MTRYKCHVCKLIINEEDLEDGLCPVCHKQVVEMCPADVPRCSHDVVETIAYCNVCGEPVCPICGSHDVVQISRVTGYLQEVGGWNAGKQQELKDRHRWNI